MYTEDELSKKAKIVSRLVAEFNNNDKLVSLFATPNNVSEIETAFEYPPHLSSEIIDMKEFKMEKLVWKDSASSWVILQLHGGGYLGAFKRIYKRMAGLYSEVSGGGTVFSVDYRVAPEYPFPAALDDALKAYEWILEQGYSPENIVIAGDSAGGGLALALCHVLKSRWQKMPAGLVLMSPWTDLATTGPSYEENYEVDPVFGNSRAGLIFDNPYIGDADPKDPRISPQYGDFTGFPCMLIQAGSNEMLLSDSEYTAAKAKAAGVKVRLSIYPGMFHVFQTAGTIFEESKMAWAEIRRFFQEVY